MNGVFLENLESLGVLHFCKFIGTFKKLFDLPKGFFFREISVPIGDIYFYKFMTSQNEFCEG